MGGSIQTPLDPPLTIHTLHDFQARGKFSPILYIHFIHEVQALTRELALYYLPHALQT